MDRHRSGIRGCLLILAMALLVPSQAACRNRALEQNGSSDSDWVLYEGQTIDEPNDDVVLAGSILSPVSGQADTVFKVGAERVELWLPVLKDKRVGVLVNHSSMVGNIHLLIPCWRWVWMYERFSHLNTGSGVMLMQVPELTTSSIPEPDYL